MIARRRARLRGATGVVSWCVVSWSLCVLTGCTEQDWNCVPPGGSIAADGALSVDFTGETASFLAEDLRAHVTAESDDEVTLWACRKSSSEMWIAELVVTKDSAVNAPLPFQIGGGGARWTAILTRYEQYQLLTEELGNGLGVTVTGSLTAFDVPAGFMAMNSTLREPCNRVQCRSDNRTLTVRTDLTW